jgi:hypothetical protein
MAAKLFPYAVLLGLVALQGCYSSVRTYDGDGRLIAECRENGVLLGAIPVFSFRFTNACNGSANPLAQTANAVLEPVKPSPSRPPGSCADGFSRRNGECYPDRSLIDWMTKQPYPADGAPAKP